MPKHPDKSAGKYFAIVLLNFAALYAKSLPASIDMNLLVVNFRIPVAACGGFIQNEGLLSISIFDEV